MAFVHASFFSQVLGKHVGLYALLPNKGAGPFSVYYLLHGLSDDYTIWMRRTRIELHVEPYPLIVVMPDGFRGFYTDNAEGPAYGRYLTEDVVEFVERSFPAIAKRAGRCIGGLSMGGYGAMRLGLAHPEMFASVNSHSGALNFLDDKERCKGEEMRRIFGPHPHGTAHDLCHLVRQIKRRRRAFPKLLIDCGTEDFLLQQNRDFHAFLAKEGVRHEYAEYAGAHNWDYWDVHVREALAFHAQALGLRNRSLGPEG